MAEPISTDRAEAYQCGGKMMSIYDALVKMLRELEQMAPPPDRWVLVMEPSVYTRLKGRAYQKLMPYRRRVWRKYHDDPNT